MERTPLNGSSAIVSVGHDPATNTMEVEFTGGRVYTVSGVTPEEHAQFVTAPSAGKHFNQHYRGRGVQQQPDQP